MDMRPAGYVPPGANESSTDCLKFQERPTTPEHIRKWRTSQRAPGEVSIHPGLSDFKPDKQRIYGNITKDSDHVSDVFPHGPQTEMGQYMQGRAEAIYRQRAKEPLGKSMPRGTALPSHMQQKEFAFGVKSDTSESAKGLLYPEDRDEDQEKEAVYRKSHGNFAPGEQRRRDYNWQFDPASHRFGVVGSREEKDGASACLRDTPCAGSPNGHPFRPPRQG